jgi:hypothetical protein
VTNLEQRKDEVEPEHAQLERKAAARLHARLHALRHALLRRAALRRAARCRAATGWGLGRAALKEGGVRDRVRVRGRVRVRVRGRFS